MKKRVLNVLILTLAVSALAFTGCGKDKDKAGDKGGDKSAAGAKSGDKAGASRAVKGGDAAGSAFAVFAKNSDIVIGVNLAGLKGTPLWDQVWPLVENEAGEDLKEFKAVCGVDAVDAVNSVILGGAQQDEKSMVVVAKLGVDKGKVKECITALAKKEGEEIEIVEDGKLFGIKGKDDKQMWGAWLDDKTVMSGPGGENDRAFIETRLAGTDSLSGNAEFMDLVNKTDTGATFWMAMNLPPEAGMGMPGGAPPKNVWLSVTLGKGMKIDMGVRFASDADAKAMADQATQLMGGMGADPMVGKFIKKTKISAAGTDLLVKIDLDEAEFNELLAMVKEQLPMIMMMMGGM